MNTNNNNEIAFLLGAGAVKDAELPMAHELTVCVEEAVRDEYPDLLPLVRFISGAIQFGKGCRGESATERINIEDLLTACTFLASRNKHSIYPFVSAWHERISELENIPNENGEGGIQNSFEFLVSYSKMKLRDWLNISDPSRLKYLRSFKDFINREYRLRIFTLNYDECIERALQDEFGGINDIWTNGFDETGWNPDLLISDDYKVYLYKIHGSLDWVRDEKFGICSVKWPIAQRSEELGQDFDPLLIFGSDVKMQPIEPYLTLLFHFQKILNASRILVVIGYSFGDDHINSMIREALQSDSQMRCIVVGPNSLAELLPLNSEFGRLVGVEERFIELKYKAKDAFELDEILKAVESALEEQSKSLPF